MKRIKYNLLIVALIGLFPIVNTAQTDTTIVYGDTVRQVRIDVDRGGENKYVNVVRRRTVKTRVSLLEVGLNTLLNTSGYSLENGINPFDLDVVNSVNFTYYPFMQRISIINRKLNLIHGIGLQYNEFNFQNPVRLVAQSPQLQFEYDEGLVLKKNKLKAWYLTLPIMINIESNPYKYSRSFRISGGIEGGIRLRSWTKRKSDQFGKEKRKDDYNLNQFKVALRGQIGVGVFNLFSTVSMTELFDPDQNGGYEVFPFTIGIVVLPF